MYLLITSSCEIAALVTTFNLELGITGAILTKLDGDSRGGAALSVKEVCFIIPPRFHQIILFQKSFFLKNEYTIGTVLGVCNSITKHLLSSSATWIGIL